MLSNRKNGNGLRVIKTARDELSINKAARDGFLPVLKRVNKSNEIRSKYSVLQSKKTGEITVIGDARVGGGCDEYETVIDFTFYYPHDFPSPFAAYLVPRDVEVGERVFIEDLIEDFISGSWNQGDTYRLESCEAVWNGKDFDIQYNSSLRADFLG